MPIKSVKTVGTPPMPDCVQRLQVAYDAAVSALTQTIQFLNSKNLANGRLELMNKYFELGDSNQEVPQQIIEKLNATLHGMTNYDFDIEIIYFNVTTKRGTKIYLAYKQVMNANQCIRYLIHEASHAFADSDCYGGIGYINNDGNFRNGNLNGIDAKNNADSLACFVVGCFGLRLV